MSENREAKNDWTMLGGVAVGAVIALLVGPPLVGGAAIGVCLGLLFAPRSGTETRRGIADWAKTLGGKTKIVDAPAAPATSSAHMIPPPPPQTPPAPNPDAGAGRELTKTGP